MPRTTTIYYPECGNDKNAEEWWERWKEQTKHLSVEIQEHIKKHWQADEIALLIDI